MRRIKTNHLNHNGHQSLVRIVLNENNYHSLGQYYIVSHFLCTCKLPPPLRSTYGNSDAFTRNAQLSRILTSPRALFVLVTSCKDGYKIKPLMFVSLFKPSFKRVGRPLQQLKCFPFPNGWCDLWPQMTHRKTLVTLSTNRFSPKDWWRIPQPWHF